MTTSKRICPRKKGGPPLFNALATSLSYQARPPNIPSERRSSLINYSAPEQESNFFFFGRFALICTARTLSSKDMLK